MESPCNIADEEHCDIADEEFIGPFWIPFEEIVSHPAKRSFEFPEQETFIRFYNASISQTPVWLLKNVRFFNDKEAKDSLIDKEEEDDEFLVRFIPGADNPYFELSLKNTKSIQEQPQPVKPL